MEVVAEGGANVLVYYGDANWLYRICKKFPESLRKSNHYTVENFRFIIERMKPLFGDLLCPIKLESVPLSQLKNTVSQYFTNFDDNEVKVLKIKQLKDASFRDTVLQDHFTAIHRSHEGAILVEIKPKWLFGCLEYCRNCTHNIIKGRKIDYCYKVLLQNASHFREIVSHCNDSLPVEFTEDMIEYFSSSNNILNVLHDAQQRLDVQLLESIKCDEDVSDELLECMILRDVTCFLKWYPHSQISVTVVDVDLKLKEKWIYWLRTHRELEDFQSKVLH